ncbi:MAG: AMP-binding protein [Planctomyces sp.]|nr:AMP-binding protein [Planctomyces sp.]
MTSTGLARLSDMLREVLPTNAFWKARLAGCNTRVSTPEDLQQLPFVTKAELVADQAAHPPYGSNLTFPRSAYCRLHQTSGTTGRPLRWLDTPDSWRWILGCWETIYSDIGIREEDVFAFPFSFGPFLGFWAAFEGACRLGRLSLAGGGLSTEARLAMIAENSATVVCCTPTYALRLAETAERLGLDLASGGVRTIVVAGEPGGNVPPVRERIERAWGARVFDHWGMTELGPLAIEPEGERGGLRMLDSACLSEVIDPASGQPAAAGALGELVVTNLGRVGQPLIRYRTGDLVRARERGDDCVFLDGGVLGRTDDMFIVRGNNVFPSSIEAVVREFPEVVEFRMTLREERSMPHLELEIEAREDFVAGMEELAERVRQRVKDRLNFQPEVTAAPPGSLPRYELKGRRFRRAAPP